MRASTGNTTAAVIAATRIVSADASRPVLRVAEALVDSTS